MQQGTEQNADKDNQQINIAENQTSAKTGQRRSRANAANPPAESEQKTATEALPIQTEWSCFERSAQKSTRTEARQQLEDQQINANGATQHEQQAKIVKGQEGKHRLRTNHGGPGQAEAKECAAGECCEMVERFG